MFQNVLMVATVGGIVLVFFGGGLIGAWLAKKKINVLSVVDTAASAVSTFSKVESTVAEFLPEPYKGIANFLTDTVKKSVEVAQDLADSGNLTADQRKAKATELINSALTLEKIPVTDSVSKAVSLTIDLAATLFVPHKAATVTTGTATTTPIQTVSV